MRAACGVNAAPFVRAQFQQGSVRSPSGEHDLQLAENQVPILAPCVPVPADSLRCQIEHPAQRIVIGKARLVLRYLPELPVKPFDDVRRVYDFPNLGRVFKKMRSGLPNYPSSF